MSGQVPLLAQVPSVSAEDLLTDENGFPLATPNGEPLAVAEAAGTTAASVSDLLYQE